MKINKPYRLAACIAVLLLGGCSSNPQPPDAAVPTETAGPASGTGETGRSALDTPVCEEPVNKLHYSRNQLQEIREAAQKAGLVNVYIPEIGGGPDDYFEEAKVDGKRLTLHFIRMAITESMEELEPAGGNRTVKKVQLSPQLEGKWISEEDSTVEYLYGEIDNTHFEIFSARMFDRKDFEQTAQSLILLQQK
ncbi:hypothetical protein MKZ24_28280 [Paenibacillus sp. FSL R7-0297]|uniref:hypothetical protein n=1 Tax=unclassified Paenibacillus TaxID=185978 RepID=UPI0018CF4D63|nr:hypothetical protein [Paenibacillus sp. FSL R5-0912]